MIFALVAFVVVASGSRADEARSPVEAFIDVELPASGAPGVAYAIVDHEEIRVGARGRTLVNGGDPVTPDTPFLIGSISKSFTALAIVQLAESGTLELDTDVASYLDVLEGHSAGAISLRQLLSHTSGYSTVQGNRPHAERVPLWEPDDPPGTRWEYSNLNYQVLGAVVEAVSGQDYPTYLRTHVFEPLGMNDSFVSDGRVTLVGHRPWFGGTRPHAMRGTDPIRAPAGGIVSTANDLARYLAMMSNGGNDIISGASKAEMLRPASEASPFYGLGWFIDVEAGTAFHSGLVPGTETLATLSTAEPKGVVVLVNANGGIGFGDNLQLRNGITAKALGLPYAGEGSLWWPKSTYLMVMSLPALFLASAGWAWRARARIRAKSGASGLFSLWFPLIATAIMAGVLMLVVPRLFGGTIDMLSDYQPDFAMAMVATAVFGPAWAIFRLFVAYGRKTG